MIPGPEMIPTIFANQSKDENMRKSIQICRHTALHEYDYFSVMQKYEHESEAIGILLLTALNFFLYTT